MKKLSVTYSVWRELALANQSWAKYHVVKDATRLVATGDSQMQLLSDAADADVADHAATFPASVLVALREDAMALLIGHTLSPTTSTHAVVVAPTFLHASEQARLEGFALECEPGQTTILDVETTTQLLVQGGQFWAQDCAQGDKAQFAVVDKNDVLGLHTQLGLPLGTPIELVRYVKDYRLPTSSLWREEIIMPTVAPVAAGLFMRTIYEAASGGGTRHLGVLYRWYIGG